MIDSHVLSSSVKFKVRHPIVKDCNNVLAGNNLSWNGQRSSLYALVFTMRPSKELGCICTSHFILGRGKNVKLRGTKLSEKLKNMKHEDKSIFKKNKGTGTSCEGLVYR